MENKNTSMINDIEVLAEEYVTRMCDGTTPPEYIRRMIHDAFIAGAEFAKTKFIGNEKGNSPYCNGAGYHTTES